MTARTRNALAATVTTLVVALFVALDHVAPPVAAGGLLHPWRRPVTQAPPPGCRDATFDGEGVTLRGWQCQAVGPRRGTLVYLHGVADNRTSAVGAIQMLTTAGLDVVAYDSRAHGESTGTACTYGYLEKQDLRRVVARLAPGHVVLLGTSLGAAIALQDAPDDSRISGVVAAETFSDLKTVARERAPCILTNRMIRRAFALAESQGGFRVDEVSPEAAARRIRIPVLLIHGAADIDTSPDHTRRVFAALAGPKALVLVAGAHHNDSLNAPDTWRRIRTWLDEVLGSPAGPDYGSRAGAFGTTTPVPRGATPGIETGSFPPTAISPSSARAAAR